MQNQNNELDWLAEELTLRRKVDDIGVIRYYNEHDRLHRVYGPAVIWPDGTEFWYQNGEYHRFDGPAVIDPDGSGTWYINGFYYTEEQFNAHPLVVQHRDNNVL